MSLLAPLHAVGDMTHLRICPLYSFDDGGRIHMVGSAIPFRSGKLSFLITAAHVCLNHRKRVVPLFAWGTTGPRVLGHQRIAWEHVPGQTPDTDIALIALSEEDCSDLTQCYIFSDPSTVTTALPPSPRVHYMVTGYPSVRNKVKSRDHSPPALATHLITGNIKSVTGFKLTDKTDEHHFAICFKGNEVRTFMGNPFRVPKPQGMSGGGVWRLEIDTQTLQASAPLLVGVGIEFHKTEQIFIVSRIQNAIPLAHDLVELVGGFTPGSVVSLEEIRSVSSAFSSMS